jgi:hypothetical protein
VPNKPAVRLLQLELGDWPGGSLSVFECAFPDAPDGGIDLILPIHCAEHMRSWYWCPNAGLLWCDGGAPEWDFHTVSGAVSQ